MTKSISDIQATTDTFAGWLDKTNDILLEVRTSVVTTANSSNVSFSGISTSGNAVVNGVFTANAISLAGDSNSDAFIRVIPSGNTESGNTSGDLIIQSKSYFNANVYANNITVDIEGNVVSNGTSFDVTVSNIASFDADDFYVTGTSANLNSTTLNITGTTTDITSNVVIESANVTIGNGSVSTATTVDTATLTVGANTTLNGTTLDLNANVDLDNTTTDINATNLIVTGTVANVGSTTINIKGTTANVDGTILNISSNTYVTGANVTVDSAEVTLNGNVTVGNNTADAHTVTGNTTFNDSIDVTGQANVGGLFQVTGNVVFYDELTVNNAVSVTNTITVSDLSSLDGGIDVNGSNFTVTTAGAISTVSNLGVAGTLTANGNVTLGNNASDTHSVYGDTQFYHNVDVDGTLTANGNFTVNSKFDVDASTGDLTQGDQVVVSVDTHTHVGATAEVVASFSASTYKSGKLIIHGQDVNGANSEIQITEALYVTDGTDVFLTSSGTISTDPDNTDVVFTLDADVNGGNVRLKSTATYGADTKLVIHSTLFKNQ